MRINECVACVHVRACSCLCTLGEVADVPHAWTHAHVRVPLLNVAGVRRDRSSR